MPMIMVLFFVVGHPTSLPFLMSVIDARIAFLISVLSQRLLMDVLAVLVTLIFIATGCALAPA